MRAGKMILVASLLVVCPAPISLARAEPPLVAPEDAAHLANLQAQITATRAKAELAEAQARLAKAAREAEGGTDKPFAAAPAAGAPSTPTRSTAPRPTGEEPVVVRIQRAGRDGPLTAILLQGSGPGGAQGTTLAVRKGVTLPNGLRVADITADGVLVAGADDVPRALAFGAPRR